MKQKKIVNKITFDCGQNTEAMKKKYCNFYEFIMKETKKFRLFQHILFYFELSYILLIHFQILVQVSLLINIIYKTLMTINNFKKYY